MSHQLLADDAEATRLYDSAELLAHNLLMAMRERRLLETKSTMPEQCDDLQPQGTILDDVPLELTMAVGVPDSNQDVRPEILTLDLTGRMNSSHL